MATRICFRLHFMKRIRKDPDLIHWLFVFEIIFLSSFTIDHMKSVVPLHAQIFFFIIIYIYILFSFGHLAWLNSPKLDMITILISFLARTVVHFSGAVQMYMLCRPFEKEYSICLCFSNLFSASRRFVFSYRDKHCCRWESFAF